MKCEFRWLGILALTATCACSSRQLVAPPPQEIDLDSIPKRTLRRIDRVLGCKREDWWVLRREYEWLRENEVFEFAGTVSTVYLRTSDGIWQPLNEKEGLPQVNQLLKHYPASDMELTDRRVMLTFLKAFYRLCRGVEGKVIEKEELVEYERVARELERIDKKVANEEIAEYGKVISAYVGSRHALDGWVRGTDKAPEDLCRLWVGPAVQVDGRQFVAQFRTITRAGSVELWTVSGTSDPHPEIRYCTVHVLEPAGSFRWALIP